MRRVAAKVVLKLLTFEQKSIRQSISKDMRSRVNSDDTFLKRIITRDETWVCRYDIETKKQASQWICTGEPRPRKARQCRSNMKVFLIAYFDWQGVVYHEFTPNGQTIIKEYYLDILRRLRETIHKKRPILWRSNSWVLHHNNAPAHKLSLVSDFLEKYGTITVPQHSYSPDLALVDYFLFPKLKIGLKGRRLQVIENIKKESLMDMKAIPKSAYEKCFQSWMERWRKSITRRGEYFEGDNVL